MKNFKYALLLASIMSAGASYAATQSIEMPANETPVDAPKVSTFEAQPNADFSDWRCWLISPYFCYNNVK
ncbi:hypothetical protein [Duganella qianjiadongensis]|uniref:Uncharacterized protein n=1 Tax=Duganella qianjiadongensis TaxID=2692176 RepID=A0ABW9VQ03_9BURK|nr:hypothetical protein [Duganella qianjiadongensis]MYM41570.1 hypothetical protein [Duganella qianjiadongensis]